MLANMETVYVVLMLYFFNVDTIQQNQHILSCTVLFSCVVTSTTVLPSTSDSGILFCL